MLEEMGEQGEMLEEMGKQGVMLEELMEKAAIRQTGGGDKQMMMTDLWRQQRILGKLFYT